MNGFAIFKQDYPQNTIFHFNNFCPPTNSTIRLYLFLNWVGNRLLYPFCFDFNAVRSFTGSEKVLSKLQLLTPQYKTSPPDTVILNAVKNLLFGR
jgi:hypothetical protein